MLTTTLLISLVLGQTAKAANPPKPDRPEDSTAIAALTKEFVDAFNAGDGKRLALTFTEDGHVLTETADVISGRKAIEEHYLGSFSTARQAKIELEPGLIRFLSPDVAVEEGLATLTFAPGEPAERTRYTVNYVKRDGKWLHAYVRDHITGQPADHNAHLKPLQWMVGDWVSEGSDAVVHTKCQWVDDGHFLLRSYEVVREGKPDLKGTERIGWDPLTKRVRSWIFDSGGGFGEATWVQTDEQTWTLHASGVSKDGEPATLTRVVTRLDPHRIKWSQRDAMVDGEPGDALGDYVMVALPPKPKRP